MKFFMWTVPQADFGTPHPQTPSPSPPPPQTAGGRLGQFQSGCRAVTGDVKAVGGWAVTGGWKCSWGWCWGMGMPLG